MAVRAFTIVESRPPSGSSSLGGPPAKFEWTAALRNAPRTSWRFGLQQRTVREDYPGGETPVEQVLGWSFTPFSCAGVWDDRFMGTGAALQTLRAFEAMVQRGNLCEFKFETIAVFGLITNVEFDYKRADYIAYSFTVSPHSRTATPESPADSTEALKSPDEYYAGLQARTDQVTALAEQVPATAMTGSTVADTQGRLDTISAKVAEIGTAVEQRLQTAQDYALGARRVAHAFGVVRTVAQDLVASLISVKSDADLAWETAVGVLDFEVWSRGLRTMGRLMVADTYTAEKEMSRRVTPKAMSVYRPRENESLYAISQRFYGTPHRWQLIAQTNQLSTINCQGTEVLVIPELR
jgi:hypothetical protein